MTTGNPALSGGDQSLATPATSALEENRVYRKITRRLVPIIFIAYLFAFLDRINIGYAQLQMKQALGFSDAVYGFGAGVFFISYLLLEVPSNLLFERIGARLTFLRIMVLWGLVSAATMFVSTPLQFYVLRFLLGAFEAGFFPGIILYLTWWYPSARRGRVTGQFLFAMPVAGVLGGPLSGWIMSSLDGVASLGGWQWCFLLEGLPTVALGVLCYVMLANRPGEPKWLDAHEKNVVLSAMAADQVQDTGHGRLRDAFIDPRIYAIALIYFSAACGAYTFSFWLPTMIKALGVQHIGHIGWYSTLPYAFGAAGMLLLPWSSDRRRERRWHLALAYVLGASALAATTLTGGSLAVSLVLLCVSAFFVFGAGAVFWTIPPTYLSGKALAPGIAVVSSLGILGGLISPTLIGFVKTVTGNLNNGLYVMSAVLVLGAVTCVAGLSARAVRVGMSPDAAAAPHADSAATR
jgi:MFS family permease